MVYRGRPSAACFSCRARRIKCDQIKPECTQCKRIRTKCPGYRNPLDENFRDESERVIKRAEKQYKNAAQTTARLKQYQSEREDGEDSWDSSSSDSTALTKHPAVKSLTWSMDQTVRDIAVAHFMTSYVPGSHFDYLPELYGTVDSTTVLPATINAAAIASLGRDLGQGDIMKIARQSYAHALTQTNMALANPKTAANDATLISVLLLSLFEAIVWESSQIPENWLVHSKGAFEILKLRGPEQFRTDVGRRLFTQVANITCINNMRNRTRIPQELADLVEAANGSAYEAGSPRYRLATMSREMSNLIADIDEGKLTLTEVIDETTFQDNQYIIFTENFPPEWQYEEVRLDKQIPGVHGWTYHRYPNTRVAKLWNSIRMSRILLNEVKNNHARLLSPSPYSMAMEYEAVAILQRMATDIAASIPQFTKPLGLSDGFASPGFVPDSFERPMGDATMSRKAAAASLMWPLSVVRATSLVSEDVRLFAKEQLKLMGKEFRLPQAEKAATEGRDEDQDSMRNGLHMFYVS